MERPYLRLSRHELTRLALTSLDTRVVAAALEEMRTRSRFPAHIVEFAGAHLQALTSRDRALHDLQHFRQIFPELEQRVRTLESRLNPPLVN